MNFPRLSSGNVVSLIAEWRRLWNDQIIPKLNSFNIIQGAGIRVDRRESGWVIHAEGCAAGRSVDLQRYPFFAVTVNDKGELEISGGYVNRNGIAITWWPGETIKAETGTLCICSEPVDKLGNWSPVQAKITSTISPFTFPVAAIKVEGGAVNNEQYPVTVAMIIYSKRCPIAEL